MICLVFIAIVCHTLLIVVILSGDKL